MKKLFYIILFASSIFAQMVPHPSLVEKIKKGEIEMPYALKHQAELKARGVDAAWTSDELSKQNSLMDKKDVDRIYGPANPTAGTFKAIFLFVDFSDKADQVSISFFDALIFGNTATSMRGYYSEISYGELDLTTVDIPSTIGWKTAPQPYTYYVDGQNGYGTFPANSQGLARDIVQLADPFVDFSLYDNDGDGEIDALFIVHAGPGAEFTGSDNDIWSHAWVIPGGYATNDGVTAYKYAIQPEYWQTPGDMTIGVYAHEMGHAVFGLPDLYDLDYSSYGTGNWSLMSGGSWNGFTTIGGDSPAWPDAWNHIQMGYASPTVVTTDLIGETITATTTQSDIYKLWKDGVPGSEYFLIQNRQQVGYDSALPGWGLLIWHVDNTQSSNNNEWYPGHTSSGHYRIALEQADGNYDLEKNTNAGHSYDPFPGTTNNALFDDSSQPDSKAYDGTTTYVSVENISASGNTMTADLKVSQATASLLVTSPNGGEVWQSGTVQKIQWTSSGISTVNIELSTDSGSNWLSVAVGYNASLAEFSWTVPNFTSSNCLIRITDATNSANIDQSNSTFTISPAPQIVVVSPNGGETWQSGTVQKIEWTSSGVTNVNIELSTNGGSSWFTVAVNYNASIAEFNWTVSNIPSSNCLIKISDAANNSVSDQSNALFTIIAAPDIVVVSPNGGEVWQGNSVQQIQWTSTGVINVIIELSTNGGSSWSTIISSTSASLGDFNWTVSGTPSSNCLIKITDVTNSLVIDQSNSPFTISAAPEILVVSPNGGEDWEAESVQKIKWLSSGVTNLIIVASTNSGSNWSTVTSSISASLGEYSWTVPNIPSTNYLIKISDLSNALNFDQSDSTFTVIAAPEIIVDSPNGGEEYKVGDITEITWTSINVSDVKIEYSIDTGANWLPIIASTPSDSSYNWEIPDNPSVNCLIRITDITRSSVLDVSNSMFTILPIQPDTPQLLSPANNSVDVELSVTFEWESVTGARGYTFQLSKDSAFSTVEYQDVNIASKKITITYSVDGMKYYWRVLAEGAVNDGPFSETFIFISKLNAPDSLRAERVSAPTPNRINLSWRDNSFGETGYFIERAGPDLVWNLHDMVGANETTWWEAVNNTTNYRYRVKAQSDFAESGYSNEASVIISDVFDDGVIPTVFTLSQNYPNPFNPSTQIRFGLPFESNVKLRVINILGQTVAELVNETMISGYHTLEWNAGNLTSGIYFYSIEANSINGDKSFNSVKKMLLVK